MTKVQTRFVLGRALDDSLASAVGELPRNYGIYFARVSPGLDELLVEYDASRLTPSQVEALLRRAAIPIRPSS